MHTKGRTILLPGRDVYCECEALEKIREHDPFSPWRCIRTQCGRVYSNEQVMRREIVTLSIPGGEVERLAARQ